LCCQIFLATKFGNFWLPDGTRIIRNEPEYVHEACEKNPKRLGIETIDLYYCRRLNGKVPVEDVVGAMAELVKYLGLSECSAETLRRAQRLRPIAAVPIEHSPFTMDIEDPNIALLKTCRELGMATVAYSPLGRRISD
jgi:aryl-alcohol dehydrogenase-like predicted oxidoreductase